MDAAGYSVIGLVLPSLAAEHHAGVALIGALAATFPLAMMAGFAAAGRLMRSGHLRATLLAALAVSGAGRP
jgi:MFS family permease